MELTLKSCRCCGQNCFERLAAKAVVDPFFAAYGLQIHIEHQAILPLLDWGLRRKVNALPKRFSDRIHQLLDRLRKTALLTSSEIRIPYGRCSQCSFLAPWFEVGDDQLKDYYSYYLKEEYKAARTSLQPGFRELGSVMGSEREAEIRREQHEEFIGPYLQKLRGGESPVRMLDYGGGSGLLIPHFPWLLGAVADVASSSETESDDQPYDAVQCLHVLEHVGHPRKTLSAIVAHCRPGGLIYVEVPSEYPGDEAVQNGKLPPCHEHINKFCMSSVRGLFARRDLEIISIEAGYVNFLHLEGMTPVIRGVARKVMS